MSEPCLCCRTCRLPRRSSSSPRLLPSSDGHIGASGPPPSWMLHKPRGTGDEHSALTGLEDGPGNIPSAYKNALIYDMFGESVVGCSGYLPLPNSQALFVYKATLGGRHRVIRSVPQDGDQKAAASRGPESFREPLRPVTGFDVGGCGNPFNLRVRDDDDASKDHQGDTALSSSSGTRRASDLEEGRFGADGRASTTTLAGAQINYTHQNNRCSVGYPSKNTLDISTSDGFKVFSPGLSTAKSVGGPSGPSSLYEITFPSRGVHSATDASDAAGSLLTLPNTNLSVASVSPSLNATDGFIGRLRSWLLAHSLSSCSSLTPQSAAAPQDTDSIWRSSSPNGGGINEHSQHPLPGSSSHRRILLQVPQWVRMEVENLADAYSPSHESQQTRDDIPTPSCDGGSAVVEEDNGLQGEVVVTEGGVDAGREEEPLKKKKRKLKIIPRILRWKRRRGKHSK